LEVSLSSSVEVSILGPTDEGGGRADSR
jgi:hypothetical protein